MSKIALNHLPSKGPAPNTKSSATSKPKSSLSTAAKSTNNSATKPPSKPKSKPADKNVTKRPSVHKLVKAALTHTSSRKGNLNPRIKKPTTGVYTANVGKGNPLLSRYIKSSVEKDSMIQVSTKRAKGSLKLAPTSKSRPKQIKPKSATTSSKPKKMKLFIGQRGGGDGTYDQNARRNIRIIRQVAVRVKPFPALRVAPKSPNKSQKEKLKSKSKENSKKTASTLTKNSSEKKKKTLLKSGKKLTRLSAGHNEQPANSNILSQNKQISEQPALPLQTHQKERLALSAAHSSLNILRCLGKKANPVGPAVTK